MSLVDPYLPGTQRQTTYKRFETKRPNQESERVREKLPRLVD